MIAMLFLNTNHLVLLQRDADWMLGVLTASNDSCGEEQLKDSIMHIKCPHLKWKARARCLIQPSGCQAFAPSISQAVMIQTPLDQWGAHWMCFEELSSTETLVLLWQWDSKSHTVIALNWAFPVNTWQLRATKTPSHYFDKCTFQCIVSLL